MRCPPIYKAYALWDHMLSVQARLETLYRLRQLTREWKKGIAGYEWLTEEEMRLKGWSQLLV